MTVKWTFDARPDDVFWCTADVGWITGHTYIAYGPLAAGLTQVVFEGVPTYPNAGRFWDMIARHKVTTFYTAPTAIRAIAKEAHRRKTGARALRGIVEELMLDVMYELPSRKDLTRCIITREMVEKRSTAELLIHPASVPKPESA